MESMECYEKAGKISWKVLQMAVKLVKPGTRLLDVAEKLENEILEMGAGLAFPVNISLNDAAAHYTPSLDDRSTFSEKDVVKIDIGAHVKGYIGDNALTIDLSQENGRLLEASEAALNEAVATIKSGVEVRKVGRVIDEVARSYGFRPISNLTGHSLDQYDLHAGLSIPNVDNRDRRVLNEGDVIAIEPFVTNGVGRVGEGSFVQIYSFERRGNVRMRMARKIMDYVEKKYGHLPFAERWLRGSFPSKLLLKKSLKQLVLSEVLMDYPVLKERGGGLVSQHEVTVVVEKDSVRVLTH